MPVDLENVITFAIANIAVALYVEDRSLFNRLVERYRAFSCEVPAELRVNIISQPTQVSVNFMAEVIFHYGSGGKRIWFDTPGFTGEIDLDKRNADLFTSKYRGVETTDYLLRVIFALLIFKKGGFLFHGAGIIRNDMAYLFFGHSGSGKSTVARLSPDDIVINDDLVGLMPEGDTWMVYATPFWNPTQVKPVPASARLTGLYRLVQDKQVFLEPISGGHALAELISNIPIIPDNPFLNSEMLLRGKQILNKIPIYRLHFLPDDSFWQVVDRRR